LLIPVNYYFYKTVK